MDQVEEIKKRLDIVEFVSQYLQLKKAELIILLAVLSIVRKPLLLWFRPNAKVLNVSAVGKAEMLLLLLKKWKDYLSPRH